MPGMRFNHMELTFPRGTLEPAFRKEVADFETIVSPVAVEDVSPHPLASHRIRPVTGAGVTTERLVFGHYQQLGFVCAIDLPAHQPAATMMREWSTEVSNWMTRGRAQPEIPVFDVNLAPFVEPPDLVEHSPRHHHGQRLYGHPRGLVGRRDALPPGEPAMIDPQSGLSRARCP